MVPSGVMAMPPGDPTEMGEPATVLVAVSMSETMLEKPLDT